MVSSQLELQVRRVYSGGQSFLYARGICTDVYLPMSLELSQDDPNAHQRSTLTMAWHHASSSCIVDVRPGTVLVHTMLCSERTRACLHLRDRSEVSTVFLKSCGRTYMLSCWNKPTRCILNSVFTPDALSLAFSSASYSHTISEPQRFLLVIVVVGVGQ